MAVFMEMKVTQLSIIRDINTRLFEETHHNNNYDEFMAERSDEVKCDIYNEQMDRMIGCYGFQTYAHYQEMYEDLDYLQVVD